MGRSAHDSTALATSGSHACKGAVAYAANAVEAATVKVFIGMALMQFWLHLSISTSCKLDSRGVYAPRRNPINLRMRIAVVVRILATEHVPRFWCGRSSSSTQGPRPHDLEAEPTLTSHGHRAVHITYMRYLLFALYLPACYGMEP
ncbi:hypothetical protein EYR41_008906 [Orbilia oligospora]|uniref:Uncharacterized protein n=1 Tax=Orbilia oligospora TaxID=2813651 RepID=A0A8H2DU70_ORBOL|nr:hypothetical protein EYR41_008906 [Orbilia oligospora]